MNDPVLEPPNWPASCCKRGTLRERLLTGFQRCLSVLRNQPNLIVWFSFTSRFGLVTQRPSCGKEDGDRPDRASPQRYEPGRLGRTHRCRKRSAQPRRNADEAVNSNEQKNESTPEQIQLKTRRHFLKNCGMGLGVGALAQMLSRVLCLEGTEESIAAPKAPFQFQSQARHLHTSYGFPSAS